MQFGGSTKAASLDSYPPQGGFEIIFLGEWKHSRHKTFVMSRVRQFRPSAAYSDVGETGDGVVQCTSGRLHKTHRPAATGVRQHRGSQPGQYWGHCKAGARFGTASNVANSLVPGVAGDSAVLVDDGCARIRLCTGLPY